MVQRIAGQKSGVTATVKSYNGRKGFGFLSCRNVNGDIFFGRDALPEDAREVQGKFLEGRTVHIDFVPAESGGFKATKVVLVAGEGEELAGEIKSFSPTNGYGFVKSSSISEDVRFNASDLQNAPPGAELRGELVRFKVQTMPDGKLRAASIAFQSNQIAQKFGGAGVKVGGKGGGCMPFMGGCMPPMMQFGSAMMMGGGMGGGMGGAMQGVVKSYNPNKGFGFIAVPGIPMDFFFGKSDLQGGEVTQGSPVQFFMGVGDKGTPAAKMVLPSRGAKRTATGAGFGGGNSGGKSGAAKKRPKPSSAATGEMMSGSIKSFNASRGFGFITSLETEGDVFFLKTSLPPGVSGQALDGQAVTFETANAREGKLEARNITFN